MRGEAYVHATIGASGPLAARRTSEKNASFANQCSACATATASIVLDRIAARSATHAAQPIPEPFDARANWPALKSVATTNSKRRAMSAVA
jgi:hypothetical protein